MPARAHLILTLALLSIPSFAAGPPAPNGEAALRANAARAAAQRAAGVQPAQPAPTPIDLAARAKFLDVETFARLPADEQAKNLPAFYRDTAPKYISSISIGILSSHPNFLLNREAKGYPGGDPVERWGNQLTAAVPELTPEQMADKLGIALWLNVASHVRTVQILKSKTNAAPLATCITADLNSKDVPAFERGCNVVSQLKLPGYTDKILTAYLADGPTAKAAFTALVWLSDPTITKTLLADIERDPKTLARHAGLFQGPLSGKSAEPALLKLMSSPDADTRYHAAYALMECIDPALAQPIVLLSKDDARSQEIALLMAVKLPEGAFKSVRVDLIPLLSDPNAATRFTAIKAFATHKDMAVAPILRSLLAEPSPRPGDAVTVMQSLAALTGSTFNYNMHEWGSQKNAAALAKFDAWLQGVPQLP